MKYLIISAFLFSLNSLACQNTIPQSEAVKAIALEPNAGSKSCADLPEEKCLCYDGIDFRDAEIADNEVLDFIRKDQAQSCADESDCQSKLEALVCEAGQAIRTESEVYCAVDVMKVDGKKLVVSEAKKAAREAAEALKAQQEAAMESALKAMDCGKSAQAMMLVRNAAKNLTTEQVKQIVSTYAPIKALLDTGSLQSAVEEIAKIQADGVLVTEEDKSAIIAHIGTCKP